MAPEIIASMIPIVLFLVTGIILVSIFYYRFKERQSLIEKDYTAEDLAKLFNEPEKEKRRGMNPMIPVGIISIFFGLGIGLGIYLEQQTHGDYFIPLFLFTFTGVGFVLAGKLVDQHKEKQLLNR